MLPSVDTALMWINELEHQEVILLLASAETKVNTTPFHITVYI